MGEGISRHERLEKDLGPALCAAGVAKGVVEGIGSGRKVGGCCGGEGFHVSADAFALAGGGIKGSDGESVTI